MPDWAHWIWQAWRDLDADRESIPVGMGGAMMGRIHWTAVDRWARRYGVQAGDFEFLAMALRLMDALMIEQQRKRLSQ